MKRQFLLVNGNIKRTKKRSRQVAIFALLLSFVGELLTCGNKTKIKRKLTTALFTSYSLETSRPSY